jgi:hypothetical protein
MWVAHAGPRLGTASEGSSLPVLQPDAYGAGRTIVASVDNHRAAAATGWRADCDRA